MFPVVSELTTGGDDCAPNAEVPVNVRPKRARVRESTTAATARERRVSSPLAGPDRCDEGALRGSLSLILFLILELPPRIGWRSPCVLYRWRHDASRN